MNLGRGVGGPNGSRVSGWTVDPRRQRLGRVLGVGGLGFGDGEAEGGEGAVAVGLGAVEVLGEGTVEIKAGAGEGRERPTVAPVDGEEAAGFAGGGAGYR